MDFRSDKISIIVPFHSLEEYLPKCLQSIKDQTYQNFEVIMLANNVKDNSRQIAENFAKNDKRFLLFDFPYQSKNIGHIRNYAIKLATGKYLTWVDGDDYVSKNYLKVQHDCITKFDCQLSICQVKPSHSKNHIFPKREKVKKVKMFDREVLQNKILNDDRVNGGLMNKLFVTELAQKIQFDENCSMYEDLDCNIKYSKLCDKAVFNHKKLYLYFLRQGSLTKTKSALPLLKRVNTLNKIIRENQLNDFDIFARGVHSAIVLYLLKKCKKSSYNKKIRIIFAHYINDAYRIQKHLDVPFYKKLLVWGFNLRYKKYLKQNFFENGKFEKNR